MKVEVRHILVVAAVADEPVGGLVEIVVSHELLGGGDEVGGEGVLWWKV